jgi:hypothetical protein
MSEPQLVGLKCVLCNRGIASNSLGTFCEQCGNPVHHECLVSSTPPKATERCPKCGGDPRDPTAVEVREERRKLAPSPTGPNGEPGRQPLTPVQAAIRIRVAIGCFQVIAIILFIAAAWAYFGISDRELALYLGAVFFGLGAAVEVVAFGVYKGQSWARGPAFSVLLLSVPSFALPAAVIGLVILSDKRIWKTYGTYLTEAGRSRTNVGAGN